MYIALYRKYRPKTFEDVFGQEQITRTLKNEMELNKLSHAYLFCGTRGTGKTSTAKLLAKALNCQSPDGLNPCDACDSCRSINHGNSLDVFEIDAASNRGIDDIRNLREAVRFTPTGKYKIYIIDEVHMLTTEAFNALLKTLEEPPAYVIFILATTEPHKLLSTILSRCQRFDFKRISVECIEDCMKKICLAEGITIDDESMRLIARTSDGAMRDALTTLDQCAVFCGNHITYEEVVSILGIAGDKMIFNMAEAIVREDFVAAMMIIEEAINLGRDIGQFMKDLMMHYRNLLMAKLVQNVETMLDLSKETMIDLKNQAQQYTKELILLCINHLAEGEYNVKNTTLPRVILEITVAKMCRPSHDSTTEGILTRLGKLESNVGDAVMYAPQQQQSLRDVTKKEVKEKTTRIRIKEPMSETIIKQKWSGFLSYLKEQKMMRYRTFLTTAKVTCKEDGSIILTYPVEHKFAKEAVDKPGTKQEIQDLANAYFQTETIIKTVLEGEFENKIIAKNEVDLVKQMIDIFGEDLVEVIEE